MQDKKPSDPFQVVWPVGPRQETAEPKRERTEPVRETPVLLPIDVLMARQAQGQTIVATLAHAPNVLKRFSQMGGSLLFRGSVPDRDGRAVAWSPRPVARCRGRLACSHGPEGARAPLVAPVLA